MEDVVTITAADTKGGKKALGFILPSHSCSPSLPFYPSQTQVKLFVLRWWGLLLFKGIFFFLSVEQEAWGIGIAI